MCSVLCNSIQWTKFYIGRLFPAALQHISHYISIIWIETHYCCLLLLQMRLTICLLLGWYLCSSIALAEPLPTENMTHQEKQTLR